ncbi:MAG: hypothetical protein A3J10_00060 [Candidatus Sungbacteria bacterium RIFCSPLOWO2_02_FULL_54_10]|uniref:Isopenicillin N synthase-like Fe(2+) 2OG dioxygenase domain-containing protein n=2 Tax=Candidatus Sungiibacteriota TaxID=1817917 RepID=A0A1G2L8U0_9BACT|nr:MAG: hypothetical protein A2679_02495 [Candidatus Sungbacteria bacterium RIFCSPHIGHO2_01_FULL_54_26]OHA02750.1 MAG: hypothetical protein A3C92_00630 [Candidatus Sungbacteria bacterium RIFCSPHIGHO2_02_FULL_53_17]OHA08075.1 MAG: hypothetical protein A3B34_00815 [Candidatus Sungbacteria bacterium RIFCSPLOWO2_01_FULL_54_21]OHA12839.1 MAG: hypothetical protein A3J10_00060 [Candidatus Sungbacteria bacterium RIFCSPLOWO2_02_FULL_54_10]
MPKTTYDWRVRGQRLTQIGVRKPQPKDDVILLPSYKERVLMEMLKLGLLAGEAMADAQTIKERTVATTITLSAAVLARAQELVACGKVVIPFPTQALVPPVIEGWRRFVDEPEKYKIGWTARLKGEIRRRPSSGWTRRDGTQRDDGVYDDKKQIFHFHPLLIPWLAKHAVEYTKYTHWLHLHVPRLYDACRATARTYAAALDAVLPGYSFYDRLCEEDSECLHRLRLLAYDEETAAGKGHFDISFLTIHIAESHPGLRMGDERTLFVARPGEALLFFGEKAERLTSGKVKASWHEVTDERPAGDTSSRCSAIYFGHIVL